MNRFFTVLGLAMSVFAAGCGSHSEQSLSAGGSTLLHPMMSKWASEYEKSKGVKVRYQSIGSSSGIQQMIDKSLDFGCTDLPASKSNKEMRRALETGGDIFHIPLVIGAVVPIYNLEEVKEPLRFTGHVLAGIYLGYIKKWDDAEIKKVNPRAALPNKEIAVWYRSDDSGTNYIWTQYLAKVSPLWKREVQVGSSIFWQYGKGQKGCEGVAEAVKRSPGSIGYVDLTYALQNDVTFGLVQNKEGEFISPSLDSVTAAANSALEWIPDDLRYSITNAPGKDSYPICSMIWAVLFLNQPPDKGKQVVDFLRWVTHEGQQYAEDLHYARLPPGLIDRVERKLAQVNLGN